MPIIRRKLDANTVYPTNIRYNSATDTVQSLINGVWTDNPAADPRNKLYFPGRATADPACDAAQSVVDAYSSQISQITTAIDNSSTGFTIAGIILSFLEFGLFAVLVDIALLIADIMLTAGSAAIEAALTPVVFDTFKCIIYCHMDANGLLQVGALDAIMSDVDSQIGGLGATILNTMLSLAGAGGVNGLASTGTATGDCSACDCGCGTETIADTIDVYAGTVVERDGCTITIAAIADGSHWAVGIQWNGTDGFQLTHEEIVAGAPNPPDTWQWRNIPDTGPIFDIAPPLNHTVQQLVLFDTAGGSGFTVKWKFRTPPP